jgi:N,N-dimethylformamidase
MMPSVVGYLDALVKHPGDWVDLHVSAFDPSHRYSAQLVRLLRGDSDPDGSGHREEPIECDVNGNHIGSVQQTACGSYGVVEGLPPLCGLHFEVSVYPTLPGDGVQCVLAIGAVRLVLDEQGAACLKVGEHAISTGVPLRSHHWHRLRASYDAEAGFAEVASIPAAGCHFDSPAEASGKVAGGIDAAGPLYFAAEATTDGPPISHFDGKLEAPRLSADGIGLAWDFARGIGSRTLHEVSGNGPDGVTVNAPKRAVTGSHWDGSVHDWRQRPDHYAAIHFHRDDLYDANWKVSHRFRLPEDLRSGYYAVRLDAAGVSFHVGFVASPAHGQSRALLAVLASTVTYLAYSNHRGRMKPGGYDNGLGRLPIIDTTDVLLAHHPEFGASTYDVHRDGSGVCHASCRRPLFNMRPTGRYWNFAMDLSLIEWLEQSGIAYDVITDHELHAAGTDLLAPYRAVLTGSHPEYFSLEMLRALEGFTGSGGRLLYVGGNGFYWRVTFDVAHPGMIELRRAEGGARSWKEAPGQYYHACGAYGGLWSRIGRPPNALVGVGFVSQGFDISCPYRRASASHAPRVAFLFDGVEDEILGDFGSWGRGAAGAEIDACLPNRGAPPHLLVVASSTGHSNNYFLTSEELGATVPEIDGTLNPDVRADMVFFETPGGGAVFSVGSIAFIGSLSFNEGYNPMSKLLHNAITRFVDPEPFGEVRAIPSLPVWYQSS